MSSSVAPDLRLVHIESPVATMQLDEKTNSLIATMQLDEKHDSRIEVYSEEDELLAKQWGMPVPEMLEVLETINLHDPNEGQPEYSPEWPIDFIGDGFYANDLKWVREKRHSECAMFLCTRILTQLTLYPCLSTRMMQNMK